jgi:hypothetical protein
VGNRPPPRPRHPRIKGGLPTRRYEACLGRNFAKCTASIGQLHLRQRITYLPASRYWTLQWRETLIFGVLALLLAGVCFWSINRRRVN